jgi:hypothetical protein
MDALLLKSLLDGDWLITPIFSKAEAVYGSRRSTHLYGNLLFRCCQVHNYSPNRACVKLHEKPYYQFYISMPCACFCHELWNNQDRFSTLYIAHGQPVMQTQTLCCRVRTCFCKLTLKPCWRISCTQEGLTCFSQKLFEIDRLCGLGVRDPGYRVEI